MKTSFYTEKEIKKLGFLSVGKNVQISRNAKFYGASKMTIGNNVRIDDFCVLSGKIEIGNYVHIAVYSALFAGNTGITINDFAGISSKTTIYAESDDYSGEYLTNPTVDEKYLGIISSTVEIGKHAIIGSGSTILPGANVGEGVAVGSMSLVNKPLEPWGIYVGIPCKFIKDRSKKVLKLEKEFLEDYI